MRRHLFGALLFCVIVGMAMLTHLFAIPEPLPVFESNDCAFIFESNLENAHKKTEEIKLKGVNFIPKIKRFSAIFSCKNTNPNKPAKEGDWGIRSASLKCIGENKVLHFFEVNKGQAKYLFTQDVVMGLVSTSGDASTKPFELEMKHFRNIYVNAEYKSDYKVGSIPIFNQEFAVPITK